MKNESLKTAIDIVGGQAQLAVIIGVKQQHVWNWLNREKRVPARHCVAVEEATNGLVTRYQLRPDIFGSSFIAA